MTDEREHLYTQKLFPSVNNNDLLEFRIPPNPKGHLDLGNVLLHFKVTLPTPKTSGVKLVPQNFLGSKQFSSLEVRVNGEAVARRSCANEYFLGSYFQSMLNYSIDYQISALRTAGIFDATQNTTDALKAYEATTKTAFQQSRANIKVNNEFEILMPIDSTIFYSDGLLPSNTSLDLSFERLSSASSSLLLNESAVTNSVLELKDAFLLVPFKHDENLFQLERNAIQRPIKINFDEYVIKRFNVPKGTTSVMMSDIITGTLPSKIFWGLQTIGSYTGSFTESSSRFNRNNMIKANFYVNGKEANDYPATMSESHVSLPFVKFLENSNQHQNGYMSRTLSLIEFEQSNFILSASIDRETSGSLSFEFEFGEAVTNDLVLITCSIFDRTMKIDNHRNFQIQ